MISEHISRLHIAMHYIVPEQTFGRLDNLTDNRYGLFFT